MGTHPIFESDFDCLTDMKLLNLVLLTIQAVSAADVDCYKLLGVTKKDTNKKIKSAYRKMAVKLHPDQNKDDPNANEKFQELAWCNEVLTDEKKKKLYDKCGKKCVDEAEQDGAQGGGSPFGGGFGSMFGDFFGFGNQEEEHRKGDMVVVPLMVTLEELYNGALIDMLRTKRTYVETSGTRQCNCRMEMRQKRMGMGQFSIYQEKVCEKCPNVKLVSRDEELEIEIEKGMEHGHEIAYFGEGEPMVDGEPGDLRVVLRLQPHQVFERRGADLYTNLTISLEDAMTGFSTSVKHLDGHSVQIERTAVTWHGFKMRVKNEGMPMLQDNTKFGSMIVTVQVAFPKQELTQAQKDQISAILQQADVKPSFYNGIKFPKKN